MNVGIAYIRVSSRDQVLGNGIDRQLRIVKHAAEFNNIVLPHEPIIDDGIPGTSTNRENLEKIMKMAQEGMINRLLVSEIDRLYRLFKPGIDYLYELGDLGTLLVTSRGEFHMDDVLDVQNLTNQLIHAQWDEELRVGRTQQGKIDSTLKGNYVKGGKPPFGYRYIKETKDLEKREGYEEIIKDIFKTYIRTKNYQETARLIQTKYSDSLDKVIDGAQTARIIDTREYTGGYECGDAWFPKPDNAMIDIELFREAQKIKNESTKKNNETDVVTPYIIELIQQYGYDYIKKIFKKKIKLACEICGGELTRQWTKTEPFMQAMYKCKKCEHQEKIPTVPEINEFRNAKPLFCPNCLSVDNFNVAAIPGGFNMYKVTCQRCGEWFIKQGPINKYLRKAREVKKEKNEGKRTLHTERCMQPTVFDFK